MRRLPVDRREQQFGGLAADALKAHVDAGQRWVGAQRHRLPVVEAHERDVVWDPAAQAIVTAAERARVAGVAKTWGGLPGAVLLSDQSIYS